MYSIYYSNQERPIAQLVEREAVVCLKDQIFVSCWFKYGSVECGVFS